MDRIASMSRFDENVPEPIMVAECVQCGREVYVGDEVYRIIDSVDVVHDNCAWEYARDCAYDRSGVIDAEMNVE